MKVLEVGGQLDDTKVLEVGGQLDKEVLEVGEQLLK